MSIEVHRVELAHRAEALVSITPPALIIDHLNEQERNRAYEQGYREGFDQAAHGLKKEMQEERQRWEQELQQILTELQQQEEQLASQVEQALGKLIISGLKRIISNFEPSKEQLHSIVSDALATYPQDEANLIILLNPENCELVQDFADAWISQYPGLQFKADKSLRKGDCLVQGRYGTTDARMSTKLKNLEETLGQ